MIFRHSVQSISLLLVASMGLFLFIQSVSAQTASEQFTISQQVGTADAEPPTIPGAFTATAVSTSQIDLSWTASTDNVGVTGYQIWRDGSPLATTTLLTYSDTGLTASTTYDYTVRAFDAALNYSTSTATSSATTLATTTPPATTTVDGTGNGPRVELMELSKIMDLEIVPGTHDATFSWKSTLHTKTILKWGVTGSYELGSLQGNVLSREHETVVSSLEPDTVYQFEILSTDAYERVTSYVGKFRTAKLPDRTPPHNVRDLIAYAEGDDIILEWNNPGDDDFRNVRILRSDRFYPSDPYDGFLTYEDDGQYHRDRGAAAEDGIRYYSVFTYDQRGNVSSGAVVRVIVGDVELPDVTASTTLPISFDDISFFQNGIALTREGNSVSIDGDTELMISIDYEKLPEHLKTILITITDPIDSEQVFTFLLRINSEKTRYEATLAPLGRSGTFPLTVDVFDYKVRDIATAEGKLVVTLPPEVAEEPLDERFFGTLFSRPFFFWLFLLILLLIAKKFIEQFEIVRNDQQGETAKGKTFQS